MNKSKSTRFNNKLIILLIIIVAIFTSVSILQFYESQVMYKKSVEYTEAVENARELRFLFERQSEVWKMLVIGGKTGSKLDTFFYQLSGRAAEMQDALFNTKNLFSNNSGLADQLNEIANIHKQYTDLTVRLTFGIDTMKEADIDSAVEKIDIVEKNIREKVLAVSNSAAISRDQFVASQLDTFIFWTAALFMVGFSLVLVLTALIVRGVRKFQKETFEISRQLNSYLPSEFVSSLMRRGADSLAAMTRRNITVCFTDMHGFTSASEGCEPEFLARILNEYLSEMAVIAQSWGGMVDKFMGDGIMIMFGAIDDSDVTRHTVQSVKMAEAMQLRMNDLITKWRSEGFGFEIGLRIGINTGYATVGTIGPKDRRSFTSIGSMVNIASRLEKLCTVGKILIGHDTQRHVCETIPCKARNDLQIKGISRAIMVYEIDPSERKAD